MRGERPIKPLFKNDGPKLADIVLRFVDGHRYWVFGYLAVLYVGGFNTYLRLSPDTAANLMAGDRLARGLGLAGPGGQGGNLVPGFPWLVALFQTLLGQHRDTALLYFMLGVGFVGLWLVYRLFCAAADRPTAVLITLLAGINNAVYSYALRPMPDLLFFDGLLLTLWGWHLCHTSAPSDADPAATRRSRYRGGAMLIVGLAVMAAMRSVVGVVVLAMLIDTGWRLVAARRWRWLGGLAAAGASGVVLIHILQAGFTLQLTPDEALLKQRLVEQLPATLSQAWHDTGPQLINEHIAEAVFGINIRGAAAPLSLLVLISWCWLLRANRLWALIVLGFLLQWLLVGTTRRYFIPTIPLFAYGWWHFAVSLEKRIGAWPGTAIFIVLLCFPVLGSFFKSGNTMLLQRKRPYYAYYNEGKYAPLIELAEWMRVELPDDALVVGGQNAPAELALLSGQDVRRRIAHLYTHDGPVYIIEPLTTNAQGHIRRGEAELGGVLLTLTDHEGSPLVLRRLEVAHDAIGGDAPPDAEDTDER
ncbi:glycosyltransferase family 39 protein [Phycisphaeraceae bacterium D3-23]